MNKDQADKCIQIARKAISERDFGKAEKFLQKSINLSPSDEAQGLLIQCKVLKTQSSSQQTNGHNKERRKQPKKEPQEEQKTEPNYTPEQELQCKKILQKKTFYEVLGVSEDVKEDELKKSYRKMALKFHPDRNHAPNATQAFKRISTAYQVLSNAQTRQKYNDNGQDQNFQQKCNHQYQNMEDPFDIFAAFFNSFAQQAEQRRQPRQRTYYQDNYGNVFERNQRRGRRNEAQEQTPIGLCLQYLPFLLILCASMVSIFSNVGNNQPLYSLKRDNIHEIKRITRELKLEYFVTRQFTNIGTQNIRRVEAEIEIQAYDNLRYQCNKYSKKVKKANYYNQNSQVSCVIPCNQFIQQLQIQKDRICNQKDVFYQSFRKRGIRVYN